MPNIPLTLRQQIGKVGSLSGWFEVESSFAHGHRADVSVVLTKAKVKKVRRLNLQR